MSELPRNPSQQDITAAAAVATEPVAPIKKSIKYKPIIQSEDAAAAAETDLSKLDRFLETEKTASQNEAWNKLDKGIKMQKLHIYAEQFAREQKIPIKDVRALKLFMTECLNKNKLQKTKEVVYDKNTGTIQSIPSLFYNAASKHFTLKNMERVSTKNSLTPKRVSLNAQHSAAAAAADP